MNSKPLHTLALAATLLIPAMMTAQVDRSKAPKPGPAPEVQLGKHETFTLPNGMRVIVVEDHKAPVISAQVRFDIPPILQGDMVGYKDLVGEMLTSGTARHTKEQFDERVDGLGAQVSASSNGIYATSLTRNFKDVMDLVYEVVASATFPPEEFDKAKTRLASQVQARSDDPDQIGEVVGQALTYGKGHPYGEVTTMASLEKVDRKQAYQYYRYFFRPERGYLVLVGDITPAKGREMAEHYFGNWNGADLAVTKDDKGHDVVKDLGPIIPAGKQPRLPHEMRVAFVDRPGSAQSVIRVVFPVDLKPNDPAALQAQVLNTILGGGVFNARLMQNLREDKGYTYGAYSTLTSDRWCGSFGAGCSVRNEVTDSAAAEIMKELHRIRDGKVTADELALAKSYMAGSFARSLEDPRTVARFALNTYLNDLPKDYYATYLKQLDAITADEIQQAAQRFLHPDSCTVLVVGDKEQVAKSLKGLSPKGSVIDFDANGDIVRIDPTEGATPAPKGMTAQDVLDAYIKAIGGKAAVQKVGNARLRYGTTVQGMAATLEESFQQPNKYGMEMKVGDMLLQRIKYDGGEKAKVESFMGDKELVGVDLEEMQQGAYLFPELRYPELEYSARLLGIVDINGKKAYRVNVKTLPGGSFDEYYDVATGLKVRRKDFQSQDGGGYVQVITDYGDYRAVDGVLFPFSLHQSGGMEMTLTAKEILVNKGIDAAVFSVE